MAPALAAEPTADPAPTSNASTPTVVGDPLQRLDTAIRVVDDDPSRADELAAAIDELHHQPLLVAGDLVLRQRVSVARLTLARAYLATQRIELAEAAIDAALLAALGAELPAESFGPSLAALYRDRRSRMLAHGTGTLTIQCTHPCRIVVGHVPIDSQYASLALPLATYEVFVAPRDQGARPARHVVALSASSRAHSITWPPSPTVDTPATATAPSVASTAGQAVTRRADGPPAAEPTPEGPEPSVAVIVQTSPAARHEPVARVLPRWLEISGIVLGTGLMGVGATLLRLHHTCPGDLHRDPNTCPILYDTRTLGAVGVSTGGALFIGSTVLLGVDVARQDAARIEKHRRPRP